MSLELHFEGPGGHGVYPLLLDRYIVGRADGSPHEGHLKISSDPQISRQHFELHRREDGFFVSRCGSARNPIFVLGQERDDFVTQLGQPFVVGQTRFWLVVDSQSLTRELTEFTLLGPYREQAQEESSQACFRAILEVLPELRRAHDEFAIWETAVQVLQRLLPEASHLMVVQAESQQVIYRRGSDSMTVVPSRRLLSRAQEHRCTVSFVWEQTEHFQATVLEDVNWAVVAPISDHFLYAVGTSPAAHLSQRAMLLDVVAETVSHHLTLLQMNRLQSQVGQFFSPALRTLVAQRGLEDALKPQRVSVSVMFFDLRGFSKATEAAEGDSLAEIMKHHETLTEVMTAVTECVFEHDGVVIDYQGDAVLACWGTPVASENHAKLAVRTALAIVERIHSMDLPFCTASKGGKVQRCGLGLGTGEVIAGQIGAKGLAKFGVMGRVVNLASRLEGLTKQLGVPILVNQALCEQLQGDSILCRRVGIVQPAGIRESSDVYEIVADLEQGGTGLNSEQVEAYHQAYRAYCERDWVAALELLRELPVQDPIGSFLTRQTLLRQDEELPDAWRGVLEFRSK